MKNGAKRKHERPSAQQWSRLDGVLKAARENPKPPENAVRSTAHEIATRRDDLRALLDAGYRIVDLVRLLKDAAGIEVSASTIQAALKQEMRTGDSSSRKTRAKRPLKQNRSDTTREPPAKKIIPDSTSDTKHERAMGSADNAPPLGLNLTQGATKRGQR